MDDHYITAEEYHSHLLTSGSLGISFDTVLAAALPCNKSHTGSSLASEACLVAPLAMSLYCVYCKLLPVSGVQAVQLLQACTVQLIISRCAICIPNSIFHVLYLL